MGDGAASGDSWVPYDSDHKAANPLPEVAPGEPFAAQGARWSTFVWVFDRWYDGVTLARWTQNGDDPTTGWWVGVGHGDDIGVTHWRPLDRPDEPELNGSPAGGSDD